jgi:hypothetical protein
MNNKFLIYTFLEAFRKNLTMAVLRQAVSELQLYVCSAVKTAQLQKTPS